MRWFFDIWSRFYDAKVPQSFAYKPVQDAVCEEIARRPRPRAILDVGCGTGILAARLAARHPDASVTGVDLSAGMLAQARRRSSEVTWIEADAQHLPFDNSSFDALCCTESFHWYADQARALGEFHRVLRPGGTLYIAVINPVTGAAERAVNSLTRLVGRPARWVTGDHLASLLGDAGFHRQAWVKVRRLPPGVVLPTYLTVAIADP